MPEVLVLAKGVHGHSKESIYTVRRVMGVMDKDKSRERRARQ